MAYGAPKGDNWVGVGTTGSTYTVGGTIAGLTGTAVLENNAGNDLSTSTNGAFTFSTALAQGSAYNVTVKTNPSGQVCTVTNPSGTIATANVTNVSITCVTTVVPHLHGRGHHHRAHRHRRPREQRGQRPEHQHQRRLHLQHRLGPGSAYNVTVKTNPSGQVCTVTNPSGTIATANVTNVSITCVTTVVPTYTVGGTIAGLTGTAVLENNAGNDLSTSTNGAFTFSTALAQGSAYNVTVKTNPSGQVCTVTNPSGTIATANVTNVSITCVTTVVPTYTVGGTIAGLTGTAVLENNARQRPEHQHQRRLHLQHRLGPGLRLQRHRQDQPFGAGLHGHEPLGHHRHGQRHQCLDHLCDPDGQRLRLGQLQPGQRNLGAGWTDMSDGGMAISSQVVVGTKTHLLGRHSHRRDLRQRPVLPDRGHLHPAQRWAVDRRGGASPKRRPEPLSRSLLLEQRQP